MKFGEANILRRQMINRDQQRVWKVSEDEKKLLKQFLNICSSKLTNREMDDLKQSEIISILSAINDGIISMDDIKELDPNELYDLIIGQMRLF